MKTPIIVAAMAALLIAVGGGAFWVGTQNGQQQANNIRSAFLNQRQNGGGAANNPSNQNGTAGSFGRPLATGIVTSVNGNMVQISQADGSTTSVTINSQTTIQKTVNGTLTDLQPGTRITVMGTQDSGTLTAQSIQVRPNTQAQ